MGGTRWEGRGLKRLTKEGTRRSGRRLRGGGEPCRRPVGPVFPPSRWKHRWQNINYQYLGKRKRHLVPLRP